MVEGVLDVGFIVGVGDAKPGAVAGEYLDLRLMGVDLVGNDGGDIPFGGEGVFCLFEK